MRKNIGFSINAHDPIDRLRRSPCRIGEHSTTFRYQHRHQSIFNQVVIAPSDTPPTTFSTTLVTSANPTSVAIPTTFGLDNFNQFVQVQMYRLSIETVLGRSIFDMPLDAVAYSPDGCYLTVGGCTKS